MMQITSTMVPSHNIKTFSTRRTSFKIAGSPLNSAITATPHESTRKHLSNLDKLLQKHTNNSTNTNTQNQQPNYVNSNSISKGKGILESLNLARLWPQLKAAEDMSPRHLNRLQRLLSKSMEYSPRSNLGRRWREYHGCDDWSGLLDPLDENLRREVVKYGEFIQAAYRGFHTDPSTSPDKAPLPRHVIPPDRSYRVTKGLYATSSVGLPKWVDEKAPDLGWMTQRTSWVGYVAVCDDPREIARMGRRDIVIALRGTATCLEWAENFRDVLVRMPDESEPESEPETNHGLQAKVECGFLGLYKTSGAHVPSLADSVVEEIRRLINHYKGETLSITVTGHSLGAALALLVADELSTCMPEVPPVAVFSFGGPRVGNRGFASRIKSKDVKVLRIVNSQDIITRVPGLFVSEGLDKKIRDTSAAGLLNVLDENMPWAYSHVGTELRLETKMSPYLKPNADVACCHDLESYLHLVDGFLSSKCPFRSNAKRSLWKLVNEQKSNVKKLYTSKVKKLSLKFDRHGMGGLNSPSCLPSPSQ